MLTLYPKRDCEVGRYCALRHFGGSKLGTLFVLSAMTVGGVYAYQHYFHRSGEAAIQLIPADARMVMTVDMTPSPEQTLTFKHIADSIKREGLDTQLETLVSRTLSNSPISRDLRSYLQGSLAFATLKSSGERAQTASGGDSALFVAINNVDQVKAVLARDARKSNVNGLDYYQVTGDSHCLAVLSSYLVTTDKPEDLTQIESVRRGEKPAIAAQTDYQQARANLPGDSNMMVFVSESAVAQGVQQTGESTFALHNPPVRSHYLALGMAIHAQGLDVVLLSPLDPPQGMNSGEAGRFTPLSDALWRKLPSGAYGALAFSQPGKVYNYLTASTNGNADSRRLLNEAVANFQRDTGLSITRDVLPAALGNVALAVYPDADNPQKSVDGLIVLDDTNNADPTGLAERVRALIERESDHSGGRTWRFISEERNGTTIWTLDSDSQQALQRSLGDNVQDLRRTLGLAGDTENGVSAGAQNSINNVGNIISIINGVNNVVNTHNGNATVNVNGSAVDIHVHIDNHGQAGTNNFAIRQGNDSLHINRDGLNIHSHEGDAVIVDQDGVHIQSHDGDSMVVGRNGIDIHTGDSTSHSSNAGSREDNPENSEGTAGGTIEAPHNSGVQQAVGNKTITFAQIGHAVLVATSPRMLERALAAYAGGANTLADDAGYTRMRHHIPEGTQNVAFLAIPSLVAAARPALSHALADSHTGINADDILHLFGSPGDGLVATQQYDGKTLKMTLFLPMDYEKMLHMVRAVQNIR